MKQKRAMQLMTGTAVALVILLLVVVLYVVFFVRSSAVSSDPIIAQCQQSAALAGAIRVPAADQQLFDFNCPVSHVSVSKQSIGGKVSSQLLEKSGTTNPEIYNLEKHMWKQIDECYQKVNYGVFPVFNRNWIIHGETYCVVCSVISYSPEIQNATYGRKWFDASYMMQTQKVSSFSKTIPEILADRKDTVATTQSTVFNVRTNQAVIYYRTQLSSYDRFFAKYLENFDTVKSITDANAQMEQLPGAISWIRYIPGSTVGILIGNKIFGNQAQVPNVDVPEDIDGIIVLNYDSTKTDQLRGVCDIIGNEPYIAK